MRCLRTCGCLPRCGSRVVPFVRISIALLFLTSWTLCSIGIISTSTKKLETNPYLPPAGRSACRTNKKFEEAIRLCNEDSCGIRLALWSTLKNSEHRMKHWLQLVAIPNSGSSSGNTEVQSLKKRIAGLEKARSRSPRRKQTSLSSGPSMLALPASSAPAQGQKGGRRGNNKRKSKGKGKGGSSSSTPSTTKDFAYLMPVNFRSNIHERFHKREICYPFQKVTCKNGTSCKFSHICVGALSLKMSASASPTRRPELPHSELLRRVRTSHVTGVSGYSTGTLFPSQTSSIPEGGGRPAAGSCGGLEVGTSVSRWRSSHGFAEREITGI